MGQMKKRHANAEFKSHVKKGDEVLVLTGRSEGERGRVLSVDPQRERAMVEGLNLITKHQRAQGGNRGGQQQAGRIEKSAPIHVSNLMVIDPQSKEPTRVSHKIVDGKSVRIAKRSGNALDREQK